MKLHWHNNLFDSAKFHQIVRYATVGILVNFGGYLGYLLITWVGIEPKKAMTMLYILGAGIGFIANRRWTFSYGGNVHNNLLRFFLAHAGGYLINYLLLFEFVDQFGYPHQWVQALAIIVVAGYLFITFRYYVFPTEGVGKIT